MVFNKSEKMLKQHLKHVVVGDIYMSNGKLMTKNAEVYFTNEKPDEIKKAERVEVKSYD